MKPILSKINKLKVLYTSAEVYPFAGIGGLGQVAYFLTKALVKEGVDARLFLPKYGRIDEKTYPLEMVYEGLEVPAGEDKKIICNIKQLVRDDLESPIVYFIENMEFYEKRSNVYGYNDDHIRFLLLSLGLIEFLKISEWTPDVINCADWHTGHIPNLLKTKYVDEQKLKKIATVFSIHNLMHQGLFDHKKVSDLDFDNGKSDIADLFDPALQKQNFVRRGIMFSDIVTTVSEKYSKEILTPDYGEHLDHLLREVRTKLIGILNGIDYTYMNPETDTNILVNYNSKTSTKRQQNKVDLQKEFDLEVKDVPILAMVTRLDAQKGLDLISQIIDSLLIEYDVQMVIIGGGDNQFVSFFSELENRYKKRVGTHLMPDFILPKKVFSGADIILIPSKFEPCGITQMESMRYGCVPVARNTGGLADSITDFDAKTGEGNGFLFNNYNSYALFGSIVRAIENYNKPDVWRKIVESGMNTDLSWENSAKKYISVYKRAMGLRRSIGGQDDINQLFYQIG